jgi:hypothetical protein
MGSEENVSWRSQAANATNAASREFRETNGGASTTPEFDVNTVTAPPVEQFHGPHFPPRNIGKQVQSLFRRELANSLSY